MKLHNFSDSLPSKPTVLTIGTFDGVHLGHQKIIKRLLQIAEQENVSPTILTFFPHPRMVLQPAVEIKLLNTIKERKDILKGFGVEYLVIKTFDKEFSKYTAEDYVREILVEQLLAKYVVIGYDHHFGRRRSAGIEELKALSNVYNFKVEEISAKDVDDVSVSSTKIRKALDNGDIETANNYLGYSFYISANVTKGKGIGKTIGFPTANLSIDEAYKIIPKNGVYVVQAITEQGEHYGMMNIGVNPTVGGDSISLEVHLFDFDDDLYNQDLKIKFFKRIRDEKKFESLEALKMQLFQDQAEAKDYILHNYG